MISPITPIAPTIQQEQHQLPVIIVGAGPCGLVAALALRKYGVPFVILERASRSKICSNAGSGFELAPTAVEILKNRLGIDVSKIMSYYRGMGVMTITGKMIRMTELPPDYKGGSVNRAEMQNHLLELLFPTPEDEEGVLFCGSGLESYKEYDAEHKVVATLQSGQEFSGCVLLACDGIHSRVRGVLHGGYDPEKSWEENTEIAAQKDPLHFCGAVVYWGKTPIERGSELDTEFQKVIQKPAHYDRSKSFFTIALSTRKAPAGFFVIPSQNESMLNWAITIQSETSSLSASNDGKDLTRRGGGPLTEPEKKRLFDFGEGSDGVMKGVQSGKFPLVERLIEATPAADITEAGLFDRENLELSFSSSSKLVALLGDAAHPQTPFLGQGVNMAICDAYVYATNLALALQSETKSVQQAVADCDTDARRKQAKGVVEYARDICFYTTSTNFLTVWLMKMFSKFAPISEIMNQIDKTDGSNKDYLANLDENHCSFKEQQALRRSES